MMMNLQYSGLGFRLVRMGFDDMYLCSPGGMYDKFGKNYFLCTGMASMLVPAPMISLSGAGMSDPRSGAAGSAVPCMWMASSSLVGTTS